MDVRFKRSNSSTVMLAPKETEMTIKIAFLGIFEVEITISIISFLWNCLFVQKSLHSEKYSTYNANRNLISNSFVSKVCDNYVKYHFPFYLFLS